MGKHRKNKKKLRNVSPNPISQKTDEELQQIVEEENQGEYQKLSTKMIALKEQYNRETNFIQKNAILLDITKLNNQLKDAERAIPNISRPIGNYPN